MCVVYYYLLIRVFMYLCTCECEVTEWCYWLDSAEHITGRLALEQIL